MEKIFFQKSRPFTLGVELEFQILDKENLNLVPMAPMIMEHCVDFPQDLIAQEFLQSIIEVQSVVCDSIDQVEENLISTVRHVESIAAIYDSILFASSLHPFASPAEQKLTDNDRYERIMNELQLVGRQFISQGMHVHVGMDKRETAVRVCNKIQAYLPLLLSLSTSSPYFQGEDTGLYSYRTKLFEALPLAGIAGYIADWQQYENEINMLKEKCIIKKINDLWWDVRLSPYFGTVEIRICDIPSRYTDIIALTALIQALVVYLAEEGGVNSMPVSPQLLKYNKWQAARYGLDGCFHDPMNVFFKNRKQMAEAVTQLVEILRPTMTRLGSENRCDHILDIVKNGTSAHWQRKFISEEHSFSEMIYQLHREFWI